MTVPSLRDLCMQAVVPHWKERGEIEDDQEYISYSYNGKDLGLFSVETLGINLQGIAKTVIGLSQVPRDLVNEIILEERKFRFQNKCHITLTRYDLSEQSHFSLSESVSKVKEFAADRFRSDGGHKGTVCVNLSFGGKSLQDDDRPLSEYFEPGGVYNVQVGFTIGAHRTYY